MDHSEHQAAPSAPAIPATASVLRFALAELIPSPENPRRITDDDPSLVGLADSLRTLGQIEPIVVRAVDSPDHAGVILAGERRWRAARLAGLESIEAKVLHCDDRTALEITVVENLQRSDLSPLEEARGVRSLLDAQWPIEDVATHLGKSAAWVATRAKLTDLSPAWIAGLAKGAFAWAGVAHLEQIARLPAEIQEEIAKRYSGEVWREPSAKDLSREIAETYLHQLSSAPWKLDDAELLPEAGACGACAQRSGAQQVLFADLAGKDRCTNAACWYRKVQAHTLRQSEKLKAQHERVVVLVERRDGNPAPAHLDKAIPVLSADYGYIEVKKSAPGATPAVSAETGRMTWIAPTSFSPPEVRKALGAPIKAPASGGSKGKAGATGSSAAIEAARRAAKRFRLRLQAVGKAKDKAKRPDDDRLLRLLVLLVIENQSPRRGATWDDIISTKLTREDDLDAIWEHVREALPSEYEQVTSTVLPDLAAVQSCELLVGLSPEAQAEKALREIPEPEPRKAKPLPASARPGSGRVAKIVRPAAKAPAKGKAKAPAKTPAKARP